MNELILDRSLSYMKDWLRFRYEREDIPGFVIAVSHKGKIIFNEAYGYANLEQKEKMSTNHIFRIASHSKTFTATAIMQLQERGKLDIDEFAVKYLPWLKEHKDKRFLNITLSQLLSHGAGVMRDGLNQNYWALDQPFPDRDRFKKEILQAELVINSNLKMKYSNYGYTLLGLVIEYVTGVSYNEYVINNIVTVLNLENTTPEISENEANKLVTGYTRADIDKKRLPIANVNTNAMSSATGFCSTAEDMCKYFTAHIVGSGKLLKDTTKKEMQRKHWKVEHIKDNEEYGLGFEIEYINKRSVFGHGGGFPGHITKTLCDPKNGLVVSVLTNSLGGRAGNINHSIFKLIDFFQKNTQNTNKNLYKYEGRLMSLWSIIDIIAAGDKLISVDPNSWQSFGEFSDVLSRVEDDTFKITKSDSFSSIDELVHFKFSSDDKISYVNYASGKMLPENDYIREISQKRQIG
jgi:D-alanyl-D-alanine carboxypeptidase